MKLTRAAIFVAVVIVVDGIRVYEGTNLAPPPVSPGAKNSSRGWETLREAESRSDDGRQFVATTNLIKFSKELKTTPNLYKVKLSQRGYLQFLRYLADVPPLREFTFCLWFMSTNLTHVHPLFSYTVHDKARLLSLWYEPKDATVRMSIRDDLAFKVPAIIREDKWHHLCTSWNGIHGEWILFLDGLKIGSGRIHKYKGTYVPGGGEVVVGQEPTDLHKGLDDGIEGEIFAFNMVDESVLDELVFLKPRHAPERQSEALPTVAYVPPFKQLPPMKKSYQEIKAYITSLPNKPQGTKMAAAPVPRKPARKGKPRPGRPKQRPRKPPSPPMLRKAVIYGDRRSLSRKMGEPVAAERQLQVYDENYSVHSYRAPKEREKAVRYEIYEDPEEDEGYAPRVPRQNFDVRTARRGNDMYAKAMTRAATPANRKPVFHFEMSGVKTGTGLRRSLDLGKAIPIATRKVPLEIIPVYEIVREEEEDDDDDDGLLRKRRKRSIATDELTAGFRPLPDIPDGFIDLFSASNTRNDTEPNEIFSLPSSRRDENRRNLVLTAKDLERRPGISAGTELVRRSYEECSADRGSPVRDKDRFVVSWAETPVRIYGGAVVTAADPLCGHF